MLSGPSMARGACFLDRCTAELQLGMLVQWQQAHEAGFGALERALRDDLTGAGFDV